MIKKFLAVLSGVMLLGSLVGCEGQTTSSTEQCGVTEPTSGVVDIAEIDSSEPITADIEVSTVLDMTSGAPEDFAPKNFEPSGVPEYAGKPYIVLGDNKPDFLDELDWDWNAEFEYFTPLDELGRCGSAFANVCVGLMPTEERGEIGQVKPSGWHTVKYDCVDGKYLYNRCHLLGFQLTGENANKENLITGTRYLNMEGMLPFENMIADHVKESENHVLYRVTPVYIGSNLVASGVRLEGYSVEDDGSEICFDVFCYNVQPDVTINYATGESMLSEGAEWQEETDATEDHVGLIDVTEGIVEVTTEPDDTDVIIEEPIGTTYILNTNTKKFHYSDCSSASRISDKNKDTFTGSREDLIGRGYEPCGNCEP